jgi:glycosyltransferase involved in cell wall biosynthesis
MKVGLYVLDMPATLGGGYVLRDDVARVAVEMPGNHQIELVGIPPAPPARSRARRSLARLGLQSAPTASSIDRLKAEVQERGIQMLWFNHFDPIDVGLPFILNIFDLQHRLQPWFPEVSANGQWDHREAAWANAVRRATMVTVGSQEAKEQLSMFYGVPLENIHVVPFPTPRAAVAVAQAAKAVDADALRRKYGIGGEFLFYPAQFWPHKNHVNLLHALKILRAEHGLNLSLVFTGADHGNLPFIKSVAADLGLTDVIHSLGFVPHEDVMALYQTAFALSYVSFFGPENLPPLEAMALGCPVVLSDIPGVRTLFGEVPVFVNPRSDRSIADGIKWLHDHPAARLERAQAGRVIATENSAELYVQRIHSILDDFESVRRCWP